MQFSIATIVAVFAAAASALPNDLTARQFTFTELALWNDSGCQAGDRTGTANLVASGSCEPLPAGIISATVDIDIPTSCSITFFVGTGCPAGQTIRVPQDQAVHRCFELGPGRQIGSYIATGCGL